MPVKTDDNTTKGVSLLRPMLVALAALFVVAAAFASYANMVVLNSAEGQIYPLEQAPNAQACIVFGGGVENARPTEVLRARLSTGLLMLRTGRAQFLLLSGNGRTSNEVEVMHKWLVNNGADETRIHLDESGLRTLDTVARAAQVYGIKRAALVTDEFHLSRALFLAQHFGLDAFGVRSDDQREVGDSLFLLREFAARTLAWMDVKWLSRQPKHLDPPRRIAAH